ncbi:tyrosinase family protein [Microbispora sp. SCL1-1]|uniref:tyrosinase family protein n=1 Tax=Microbispora TaxID=2005 RepID=UPI001159FC93|nr:MULTISPECIES: tyrosinase family protein [unclassified Microbispora]NJP23342.1 tyrosinase family protein [Microbispora sp. CL1-1]TQS16408.1 tyrosinase family protein [Microbispora sp. SCL1-1]
MRGPSRREMLASAVWGTAAIAFGVRGPAAHAAPVTVRRRIGDLPKEQWEAFVRAVRTLKARGTYDALVNAYTEQFAATHANGFFLPWQRRYLLHFERELQRIDPAVSVPYWDWTRDSRSPHRSVVLSKEYFGGNGDAKHDQAVLNGAFAGWTARIPRPHPLRRSYADGGKIPAWASPDLIVNMLKNPDFQVFNMQMEVHIGAVQMGIGGDLALPSAPNDPLYWVIACFGDLLWHTWRTRHPGAPIRSAYGNVTESSRLPRYSEKVANVLDVEKLGYRYDGVWPRTR